MPVLFSETLGGWGEDSCHGIQIKSQQCELWGAQWSCSGGMSQGQAGVWLGLSGGLLGSQPRDLAGRVFHAVRFGTEVLTGHLPYASSWNDTPLGGGRSEEEEAV